MSKFLSAVALFGFISQLYSLPTFAGELSPIESALSMFNRWNTQQDLRCAEPGGISTAQKMDPYVRTKFTDGSKEDSAKAIELMTDWQREALNALAEEEKACSRSD